MKVCSFQSNLKNRVKGRDSVENTNEDILCNLKNRVKGRDSVENTNEDILCN